MNSIPEVAKRATEGRTLADETAFSDFFDRTHLAVFRFIFGLHGGPRQDVEDLTAECYARAWRARNHFSGSQKDEFSWVLRIARNLVIDAFRRNRTRPPALTVEDFEGPDPSIGPEGQAERAEQNKRLLLALREVPEQQREMLVLRYLLGWRVKDIAAHFNSLENTVSVQIRRALAKMRAAWPNE